MPKVFVKDRHSDNLKTKQPTGKRRKAFTCCPSRSSNATIASGQVAHAPLAPIHSIYGRRHPIEQLHNPYLQEASPAKTASWSVLFADVHGNKLAEGQTIWRLPWYGQPLKSWGIKRRVRMVLNQQNPIMGIWGTYHGMNVHSMTCVYPYMEWSWWCFYVRNNTKAYCKITILCYMNAQASKKNRKKPAPCWAR